ncbi:MAG TPA: hypothetical protein VM925_16210 [Labilithrix sp.]|nr:hypothetical protein [Labilithrix sp.]
MMKTAIALLLLGALANTAQAHGAPTETTIIPRSADSALPRIEAVGPKVMAKDILGASAPDVELGATPPIGSSRIIERTAIERAFAAANVPAPKKIPVAVRVSRKTRRLSSNDVSTAIRNALADMRLPRGATLANVRAAAAEVPADFKRVTVDLPVLPRRAGPTTAQATVTFLGEGDAPLQKTITPIELLLPAEAAFAEISRGAPITLIVRRGLVEVSITAVAATDSDIGAILPVTIKPSGRVMRARAIDKDHAVSVEDS